MAMKAKGGPLTTTTITKEKRVTSPSTTQSPLKNTIQRGIKSPITPKSPSPSNARRTSSTSPSNARQTSSTSPSNARNVPKSGPESSIKAPSKPVISSRRSSLDKPLPPKSRVSVISKTQLPSSPSSARANASSSLSSSSSSSPSKPGRIAKAKSFTSEKESRNLRHDDVKKIENLEAKSLSPKETINDEIVEINNTPEKIEEIVEKIEDLDSSMINYPNEDPDPDHDIKSEEIVLEDDNIEPEIEVEEEDESTIIPPIEKIESFDSIPNQEHESNTSDMEEQEEEQQRIIPIIQEDGIQEEEEEEEVEDEKTELLLPPPPPPPENQELNEKEDNHDIETKESSSSSSSSSSGVKLEDNNNNKIKNGGLIIMKKQVQVIQGKREASVVSNDAIEETATKLREQRVNRVRALAGAFETVISNQ